jgi:hypothetical protein
MLKPDPAAHLQAADLSGFDPVKPTAVYTYQDEDAADLFQVRRYNLPNRNKTFRQSRPDGKGGWLPCVNGIERVPYPMTRHPRRKWPTAGQGGARMRTHDR